MMDRMSDATRARLARASRGYTRARSQMDSAREELAAAIVAERLEGTGIEDITGLVPVRQTHVNRILAEAGLTKKRTPRDSAAA